ncbi:MAG: enoyl-CoA hydratase/isomerase family protein [Burkholderiales bacterium]|nr:enoyl-CoA hydratase/isomerase family protein [Burkholderiales bacterium]
MASDAVTYESKDGIATITLNRPAKKNAINNDMAFGLRDALHQFNAAADAVAIITGAGADFTGGADIKGPPDDLAVAVPMVGVDVKKPLIAAVSGWAVGGGLVLVQMCDLCVADETARFWYPEAQVGISGAQIAGIAARIPHKVAMELMLACEPIDAQRAYQVGLVNRVMPRGKALEGALYYAEKIRDCAPLVLQMLRGFVAEVLPKGPSERAAIARLQIAAVRASADAKEGVAAFKEKRRPRFTGK